MKDTKTTFDNETAGLKAALEQVNEEMKAAADQERAKKMEEQKEQAYEDASKDGEMYQRYFEQITTRIATLEALVAAGEVDKQDQLDRNRAALDQAQVMMDGAAGIFDHLDAQKSKEAAEQEAKAGERALAEANEKLTKFATKELDLKNQMADLLTKKEETKSQRQKDEFDVMIEDLTW